MMKPLLIAILLVAQPNPKPEKIQTLLKEANRQLQLPVKEGESPKTSTELAEAMLLDRFVECRIKLISISEVDNHLVARGTFKLSRLGDYRTVSERQEIAAKNDEIRAAQAKMARANKKFSKEIASFGKIRKERNSKAWRDRERVRWEKREVAAENNLIIKQLQKELRSLNKQIRHRMNARQTVAETVSVQAHYAYLFEEKLGKRVTFQGTIVGMQLGQDPIGIGGNTFIQGITIQVITGGSPRSDEKPRETVPNAEPEAKPTKDAIELTQEGDTQPELGDVSFFGIGPDRTEQPQKPEPR